MANKVEDLVNVILDSYNECDITARIDEENMLNKDILIEIIDEIRKVLFPGFFDNNKVRSEYLKFLVGERLEFIQYHLKKQVSNAFANQDVCRECSKAQAEEKAEEVVFEFLKKIPKIREYLNTDIQAAYDGDPAAYSTDEIIFCYPGVFAITVYRIAHELWLLGVPMIPRIMTEYAHSRTGIDINAGATIGRRFFIDHGTGTVIGETTVIGDDVTVYQGVTLGGTGKDIGKRHPTIGNNVLIGAGAKILGPVTVGDNTNIAAGAVVLDKIPKNSTAVGVPARVVRRNGERVQDLDQIHIPDPVSQELCRLQSEIEKLKKKLEDK